MIRFLMNLFRNKKGKDKDYEITREVIDENSTLVQINATKPLKHKEILKIIKNELESRKEQ